MRNRIAAALAFAVFALSAPPALAADQVVYLRDGSILHGVITSMGDGMVVLETANGTLRIPEASVLRVEAVGGAEGAGPGAEPTAPLLPPTPAPSPLPSPTAGETPAAIATPAPVSTPVSPVRFRRREPLRDANFGVEGKAGLHLYAGRGWSRFQEPSGSGPAAGGLEAVAFGRLQQEGSLRVDVIGSLGFYAGGRSCTGVLEPGCIPLSIATGYLDAGLRLSVFGPPLFVYFEGAGGGAVSTFSYGPPGAPRTTTDTSGHSLEAHVAGGAGVALDPILVFGEIKGSTAPTNLGNGLIVDMGGVTFSAGLGLVF